MALITCPECGQSISDKAASCPYCGLPLHIQTNAKKKAKYGRIVFLSILSIITATAIIISVVFMHSYFQNNDTDRKNSETSLSKHEEYQPKDETYLYEWMTKHGTWVDSSILQYTDTDSSGNTFALCYDTNKVAQCRWYIKYIPQRGLLYSRYTLLTLFASEKSEEVWITFTSQAGNHTRMAFYHTPDNFTRDQSVEFGETYYTDPSDNAPSLCEQSAQYDLCNILDWLKKSFCPESNMRMSDFGYNSYK